MSGCLARMLGPATATVALASPGLSGRPLMLGALAFSSGLRLSVRGLAAQADVCHCPAKPRFPLQIPEAADTARLLTETRIPAPLRRFIACPGLARAVASHLRNGRASETTQRQAVVLECEPGQHSSEVQRYPAPTLVVSVTVITSRIAPPMMMGEPGRNREIYSGKARLIMIPIITIHNIVWCC